MTSTPNTATFICRRAATIVRSQLTTDWFKPHGRLAMEARLFLRRVLTSADDSFEPAADYSEMRCPGRVLTVAEAAERLRISRWMLYKLIHERQITTFKLGSRRLIPESAVSKLVDQLSGEEAA